MGLFSRGVQKRKAPSPLNGATVPSSSSFKQTEILKNTTVQACVNAIAHPIAILPINLYRRENDGSRQKAIDHPLYTLFRRRPNPSESPTQFMDKLVRDILQRGNAYAYKTVQNGKVLSLRLLNPDAVKRDTKNWPVVIYNYNKTDYTEDQILHITSLVTDDLGNGISPVDLAKNAVTLGNQLDDYSLSAVGNGLNSKLHIEMGPEMTKGMKDEKELSAAAAVVAEYVSKHYTGKENAGKPFITWAGLVIKELMHQSSNREAELLESRKWQDQVICKSFGVPQFIVDSSLDVKYGGLEQAMTVYLNFTLSPYLRHIEQRLATLLDPLEQERMYFEFDFNTLLRADEKSRGEFYTKLFMMGAISPAGICAKENLEPPPEAGDTRLVPANMMPLRDDVINAYMASAKQKAEGLTLGSAAKDPAMAAGSQAQ